MSENKEKREASFSDYLSVLLKWKKFLIINLLIIAIVTTGLTFLIPEKFQSSATVIVSSNNSGLGGQLGGMLSDVTSLLGVGKSSSDSPIDRLMGVLESRTLKMQIINKHKLVKYYEVENYKVDKTLKRFNDDYFITMNHNGMIEISMIHKNPMEAARIVKSIITITDSLYTKIMKEKARDYRKFIETRYNKSISDLKVAELKYQGFQERTGLYALPEQLVLIIETITNIETEIFKKEMSLEVISKLERKDSPKVKLLDDEIKILGKRLKEIKKGGDNSNQFTAFYPLDNLPKDFKEYSEVYRNFEMQKRILETLTPLYEQALMEEKKNMPSLIVLDEPSIPELKDSPKKAQIILVVLFLMSFMLIFTSYEMEKAMVFDPQNEFEKLRKRVTLWFVKRYKLRL